MHMEAIYRTYEAPTTNVVYVKFKGILCQSPGGMGVRGGYEATDDNPFGE